MEGVSPGGALLQQMVSVQAVQMVLAGGKVDVSQGHGGVGVEVRGGVQCRQPQQASLVGG
jgi:hypothetical protein